MSLANFKPIKRIIKAKNVNNELDNIVKELHERGPVNSITLEKLAYIKRIYPKLFLEYETKILYMMGLFYKPLKANSLIEVFYRSFSKYIKSMTHNKYTPVQASAYNNISTKLFFSLIVKLYGSADKISLQLLF